MWKELGKAAVKSCVEAFGTSAGQLAAERILKKAEAVKLVADKPVRLSGENDTPRTKKQEPAKVHTDAIMEKFDVSLTADVEDHRDDAVAAQLSDEAARNSARALVARGVRVKACGAPERHVDLVVSGEVRKRSEIMRRLDEWRAASSVSHPICVLSGAVGVGKTVAAVRWLMNHGGRSPCFIRTADFEAKGRYSHVWRNEWQTASGMVLDDMGVEYKDSKGNLLADLDTLIDTYASGRGQLVITTNLTWEDFQARYETRISSRIVGFAAWINVAGSDLRRAT